MFEHLAYGIKIYPKVLNGNLALAIKETFTIDTYYFQFKALQKLNSFSLKGIPLALNIPTPTLAPVPLLEDTRELGGHECSGELGGSPKGTFEDSTIVNVSLKAENYKLHTYIFIGVS